MKKFIVNKVEIIEEDGFKYYGIFDSENNDWYKEQKNFKKDTLKVMYNKDTLQVIGTNKDVSMIAPTMAGDVVEEIEYQEVAVNPNLYFVGGKLVELKAYETIKDGKIVFNRDMRIEEIKKELQDLKIQYSEKEFLFKEKYMQRNREIDRNHLNNVATGMLVEKKTTFNDWKFKDKQGNDVYVALTMQDILELYKTMAGQTTKAMHVETELREKLVNLSDKELKLFNAREEYETIWNS